MVFKYKLNQNSIKQKLSCLLMDFFKNWLKTVVLNGQLSSWAKVDASVPRGLFSGPLLLLFHIKDFPNGLPSNTKLSADDSYLSSTLHDITASTFSLNRDLSKSQKG